MIGYVVNCISQVYFNLQNLIVYHFLFNLSFFQQRRILCYLLSYSMIIFLMDWSLLCQDFWLCKEKVMLETYLSLLLLLMLLRNRGRTDLLCVFSQFYLYMWSVFNLQQGYLPILFRYSTFLCLSWIKFLLDIKDFCFTSLW